MSLLENESLIVSVELRASETDDSPGTISGLILPVGRIAADRKEVFTPGSATFPSGGVRLLLEHQGRTIMTFAPEVVPAGYRIEAILPATRRRCRRRRIRPVGRAIFPLHRISRTGI